MKVIISFDIKDERPYKAVRLYNAGGTSIGFGEKRLPDTPSEGGLFDENIGYVSYLAEIDLEKIRALEKQANENKTKSKAELSSDIDVPDSEDPDEDTWVRKSLYQLQEAKAKITLMTITDLRKDYRAMIEARTKKNLEKGTILELKTNSVENVDKTVTVIEDAVVDIDWGEIAGSVFKEEEPSKDWILTDKFAPLKAYEVVIEGVPTGRYTLAGHAVFEYSEEEMLKRQSLVSGKEKDLTPPVDVKPVPKIEEPVDLSEFFKGLI